MEISTLKNQTSLTLWKAILNSQLIFVATLGSNCNRYFGWYLAQYIGINESNNFIHSVNFFKTLTDVTRQQWSNISLRSLNLQLHLEALRDFSFFPASRCCISQQCKPDLWQQICDLAQNLSGRNRLSSQVFKLIWNFMVNVQQINTLHTAMVTLIRNSEPLSHLLHQAPNRTHPSRSVSSTLAQMFFLWWILQIATCSEEVLRAPSN